MPIAIHQPNLFPWLGYFDKIARSDCFVFLDHVQFTTSGPCWPKRVKILNNREPKLLTVPTKDPGGLPLINEMEINSITQFEKKHLRTFENNYKQTPYFHEVWPLLQRFYESKEPLLFKRNIEFIKAVCEMLGITTPCVFSSTLDCQQAATEMLVEICQKVGASTYMCGGGAQGYQEDQVFAVHGIKLVYQSFQHPVYVQTGVSQFVPGLSIVDVLAHCGVEGTRNLLKGSQAVCAE